MEDKEVKINVNVPENYTGKPITVIMREGAAPDLLEEKAPIKQGIIGTIGIIAEYLKKRLNTGQFEEERCYILVDREKLQISLVINEDDPYRHGCIAGQLEIHPKFKEFGINASKFWTPSELGLFFKMNRTYFNDTQVNRELVATLMNFTASINSQIERSVKETGDHKDNYSQVVNSNLPKSFVLNIPIVKGKPSEIIEVETFAKVDGKEVSFVLLSPGANEILEFMKNTEIDKQLTEIRQIAPNIAILEI